MGEKLIIIYFDKTTKQNKLIEIESFTEAVDILKLKSNAGQRKTLYSRDPDDKTLISKFENHGLYFNTIDYQNVDLVEQFGCDIVRID